MEDQTTMSRRELLAGGLGGAAAATAALSLAAGPGAAGPAPAARGGGPQVGMFYTCWWDERDKFHHWSKLRGPGNSTPALGHYGAGDARTIRTHYERMRECGVDFLIFDDTNTVFVDDGIVDRNIRAWFDFMDALPPQGRIPLCIAFGGELNQHGDAKAFRAAADHLHAAYAHRPSQMRLGGKPFVLWYIEKDVLPDWQDARFTVRRCYHFFRTADQARHGGWGWGSKPHPPDNPECMSFFPGWSFGDNPAIERRGGDHFIDCWLRVLKARPRYVAIADWNQWHERCAVEDCTDWTDHRGYSTPDWYRQIIQGYKAMSRGRLLPGWYYRHEGSGNVYRFDGKALVHQGEYPHRRPTLQVPEGWQGNIAMKR